MDDKAFVLLLTFFTVVVPIWVVAHYTASARRERNKLPMPPSPEDQEMTTRMVGLLEKMEARIATLEKILDVEDPRWREKHNFKERL
jgi:phage shock protein B